MSSEIGMKTHQGKAAIKAVLGTNKQTSYFRARQLTLGRVLQIINKYESECASECRVRSKLGSTPHFFSTRKDASASVLHVRQGFQGSLLNIETRKKKASKARAPNKWFQSLEPPVRDQLLSVVSELTIFAQVTLLYLQQERFFDMEFYKSV